MHLMLLKILLVVDQEVIVYFLMVVVIAVLQLVLLVGMEQVGQQKIVQVLQLQVHTEVIVELQVVVKYLKLLVI